MRARLLAVAVVSAIAFSGTHVVSADTIDTVERVCPSPAPKPLNFSAPRYIDSDRAGGEPVAVVAQDGSINVSAHAGSTHLYKDAGVDPSDFVDDYSNQTLNWRSDDGGDSWKFVGLAGLKMGPHTITSTGFSDPDYAMDAGGRIYNTEIDLANVAVFSSNDDGQTYSRGTFEVSSGDRPWLTAGAKDEVWLYINLPQQLWKSENGGLTWSLVTTSIPTNAKLFVDPKRFDPASIAAPTGLIGPSGDGIAISTDDGRTWKAYPGAGLGASTDFFDVTTVDRAGNVYRAAAGGYGGPNDRNANGSVTFNYFDRTSEDEANWAWGEQAVNIPIPEGDALFPWIMAGDDGRVAIVWYQNLKDKPNEFYIFAAYTTNGRGSTVTCSDGTTEFFPPQFEVVNASKRPIHVGAICLAGTACNQTTGDGGDRRLGDFFSVAYDAEGNIFIVSGDSLLRGLQGKKKIVGNPVFIRQTAGDRLLTAPDYDLATPATREEKRATRASCLVNPAC